MNAAQQRLLALAAEVGRLRRHVGSDGHAAHLVERVAGHVESMDALLNATAAELYKADVPADEAIAIVDARQRRLRDLLGEALW